MEDTHKTKRLLIDELEFLRQQVANLECQNAELKKGGIIIQEKEQVLARGIMDNPISAVIISIKDGRFYEVNEAFLKNYGLRREEVICRSAVELGFFTLEQKEKIIADVNRCGAIENYETKFRAKNGIEGYALLNISKIRIGTEEYLLTISSNITGQKRMEDELRETKEMFAAAFLNHPVPLAISVVKDGRYINVNKSFASIMGLNREELIGQTSTGCGFITPEGRALVLNEFRGKGRCENLELPTTVKNGEKRWGMFNSAKIKFKGEEYLLTVVTDVTDRKVAEEELRASKEQYLNFFQNAVVGATQVTPDGRILRANNTAAKLFGYESVGEINDVRAELYVDPERRKEGETLLAKYGYVENFEAECWHKDGHKIWISYSAKIARDALGNITHYDSTHQDITERKQLEQKLREKEQLLKKAQSMAKMGHWRNHIYAGILQWSDELYRLFGYLPGEIELTADWYKKHVHPDDQERLFNAIQEMFEHKVPLEIEFKYVKKDGETRFAYAKSDILCDVDGKPAISDGILQDITERKLLQEALMKSEEQYRLITENIMDCVALTDANGIFQYMTYCREILGYDPEEMIGKTELSITHPNEKTRIERLYKDGIEKIWNEIIYETKLRHNDGHYVRMEVRMRALVDPHGEVMGFVFAGRDIAQNRQMEEETADDQKSPFTDSVLSPREKEILIWIMQGKSNWDISTILKISERTVKFHVDNVMKKLSAVNRTHAVAIALQEKLI